MTGTMVATSCLAFFVVLPRNAAAPTDYFNIPANRVIELGVQYAI